MYKEFIIISLIIIIHEFGHAITALAFKWHLEKIAIYPFGGCVKFSEDINRPMYQELLILLAGPLTQVVFFLVISAIYHLNIISLRNFTLFRIYHYTLLIFNLLPVYPLDGGRLLNIIMNYFFPYKKGNKLVVAISLIIIIFLIISIKNLNFFFLGFLLIVELCLYYKKQDYLYNRFLLERYLNHYNFKKLKIITNKDNMYKEKRHLLKQEKKYLTEKEYLNTRFKTRR